MVDSALARRGVTAAAVEPRAHPALDGLHHRLVLHLDGVQIGAGADLHAVEMEDEAVVEAVQRGVRSRLYGGGRYSPTRESGVHHFHRLLAELVND